MKRGDKLKKLFHFICPSKYKLVVFAIVILAMLSKINEKYIETTAKNGRPMLVHVLSVGKPVIYVRWQNRGGKFYPWQIARLLLFAYIVTLFFFSLWLLLGSVVRRGSIIKRGKSLMYFIIVLGMPYVALLVYGNELLINVIHARENTYAKLLIRLGISPNRLSFNDLNFPLKVAAYNQDHKMTKWLLRHGADVSLANVNGQTALHIAVERNAIQTASQLIAYKAAINAHDNHGNTPLHLSSHIKMVKLLVNAKANINAINNKGQTPLFYSYNEGIKQFLVSKGADARIVDKKGNTALHYVKSKEGVNVLVSAGLDINRKNKLGKTALHRIVESNRLIKHGNIVVYEVVSGDSMNRPGAALSLIRAMIRAGAKVDIADTSGLSPLHYAIKNCNSRRKMRSALKIGKVLLQASEEARLQIKSNKLSGKLQLVVSEDKDGCWKQIAGKQAIKASEK